MSPAILRVAGWPIETANCLRSAAFAARVDQWLDSEREVEERAAHLSDILHKAVPAIGDRRTRALALCVRRSIHRSAAPLPDHQFRQLLSSEALTPDTAVALRQEAEARSSLAEQRVQLEAEYRRALGDEMRALHIIVGDASFQRALCFASPSLYAAWKRAGFHGVEPGKVHCRMYRYVMRAVGRCTPNGHWSGVALESHAGTAGADELEVLPARPLVWIAPRLSHFVTALGTRADLPGSYSDAWEALESLAAAAPEPDAPAWLGALAGLRIICSELASTWDHIALEHLQILLDRARATVNGILQRYGAPVVAADENVLVADLRAPFDFKLGSNLKEAIVSCLREYWRHDRFGLGEVLAKAERERTFGLPEQNGPVLLRDWLRESKEDSGLENTWEDIVSAACHGSLGHQARVSLRRWYAELGPVWRERRCMIEGEALSGAPLAPGSALFRIHAAESGLAIRIGALTPDPCLFYSRFHRLFRGTDTDDAFSRWYKDELRGTEARHPTLLLADLAARATADANAASRPRFRDLLVDAAADGFPVAGSTIEVDSYGRGHWIMLDGRALVPMFHSAVSLDESDPCSRSAHQIARLLGRPSLMRPIPLFEKELTEWKHLPRMSMEGGAVISPERWIASEALAAELGGHTGLDRFIAWRRFVRTAGLPPAIYWKHYRSDTEILLHTDSVLGVENLGRTLATYPADLRLQEAYPPAEASWVRDDLGRHYLAELAIAWNGDAEFWSEYASCAGSSISAAVQAGAQ